MKANDVAKKMLDNIDSLTDFDKIMDYLVDEIGIDPSVNDIYKIEDAMSDMIKTENGYDDKIGQFCDLLNDMWTEAEKGNVHGVMNEDALE